MTPLRRFRWLLRMLPFEMREAHGRDMEQVFRDSYAERTGSPARFWLRTAWDILRIAPRQHAEAFAQDVRYGLRTFGRSPVFALTAILTIALGIGAVTAVFAIVNAVLLKPLPFLDPAGVAVVWTQDPVGKRTWLSMPELSDVRERVAAFEAVAGATDMTFTLTGAGDPEEVSGAAVSGSFARVFGFTPQAGRLLEPPDDQENAQKVAVLSDGLWRRRFGARPDVVGSVIRLYDTPYTVAGVMPRGFALPPPSSVFPADVDVWVALEPHATAGRDVRFVHAFARLREGATLLEAQEQAAAAGRAVSAIHAEYRGRSWSFDVALLQADLVRPLRPALLVLLGIVALVLFIASANVAALLLSRAAARQHEIAVRAALGATSARLARQLVTESLLLGALGCAGGIALAALLIGFAHVPPLSSIPRFSTVEIDWTVVGFAAAVALVSTAFVAVAPLVIARVSDVSGEALRARERGRVTIRAGQWLAAGEIALACTVLVVALVLARGFGGLLRTDTGFRTDSLVTFRISLPPTYATAADINGFFDRALERLRALPGVERAAAVTQLPLSGAVLGSTFLLDPAADRRVDADLRGVTPDYFATMGIDVVDGRGLTSADRPGAPLVAVVDEQFARTAWPGESAVGKRIRWFRAPDRDLEVVGVVRPVRHRGFDAPARETVYRPHAQYARPTMFVVLQTGGSVSSYAAPVRETIRALDPNLPIADSASMASLAERSLAQPALGAALSSLFAAIALVLTTVGTYGVLAFAVSQRRREVGIRLALGATPRGIVSLVLKDGFRLAAAGLAIGIPGALVGARYVSSSLPLAVPLDAATAGLAVGVILGTTVLACWIPSRRAARVSPAEPLHHA